MTSKLLNGEKGLGLAKSSMDSEQVYQRIYDAIVENQLMPNSRLQEESLAKVFNVSRTIIREALQRLTLDKIVFVKKNKGASVYHPTIKESKEIFFTRRTLEKICVENVIKNLNAKHIDDLERICENERYCLKHGKNRDSIKYSVQFHVYFVSIFGNKVITEIVKGLAARTSLIISTYGTPVGSGCSCGTHSEFIELLKLKKVNDATAWLEDHFHAIEDSLNFHDTWDADKDFSEIFM